MSTDKGLRLEWVEFASLTPNAKNWRRHPAAQRDALEGVLSDVGWAGAALYNEATGRLVDGHLRLDVALRRGDEAIPVLIGSWSEAQEAEILATLDPIAAMATTDAAALDALLDEVNTGSAAVMDMLAGLAEEAGLYAEPVTGGGGDDFDTTPDESGPTRTQTGDLWQLGNHRLLVGDSTDAASVARLMAGERAGTLFTDPPYGVNVVGGNGKIGAPKLARNHIYAPIAGDDTTDAAAAAVRLIDYKAAIIWGGNYFTEFLPPSPCWIIWDKREGMTSNNFADCEIAWTSHTTPARIYRHLWSGMIRKGSDGDKVHPTQKPVALHEQILTDFTEAGELVADPFLGSGTTLIAAERLGRRCYGCEIEPRYADIILRRWEAETGAEAVLLERVEAVGA